MPTNEERIIGGVTEERILRSWLVGNRNSRNISATGFEHIEQRWQLDHMLVGPRHGRFADLGDGVIVYRHEDDDDVTWATINGQRLNWYVWYRVYQGDTIQFGYPGLEYQVDLAHFEPDPHEQPADTGPGA